jgi:C-terminal processing protease CtpA/Prc
MGEDWNGALPTAIAELEAAGDSLAYVLALNAFVRRIHDSHGGFENPTLLAYVGTGRLPVQVRFIEERPVVTALLDSTARVAGFRIGDEVLQVDGQAAARRRATMFVPGAFSTPQAEAHLQGRLFLRGPMGSEATVLVRNGDGRSRTLKMTRVAPSPTWGETTEASYKLLPNGVGYADLSRLQQPQVDSMFERFSGTRAIVFDMRGYPTGTAWAIAPRLADRPGKAAARFKRPLRLSADTLDASTTEFVQTIPPSNGKPRYTGRTVMLIDERAVSQAEHTGLFFEAANGTVFVGSPTMGANGDVTTVLAPGGVVIWLTGHDVRHADGRQLQRVGLQPHVPVRPTIKGVRAGRDEVLEAALKYLRE